MWVLAAIFLSVLQAAASPEGTTGQTTTILLPIPTKSSDNYSQNLTVVEMTPRSISLRWSCRNHHHDKYEMTLKPLKATYRVIETIPRNSCHQTIENLLPDTDYQIFITLFTRNVRKRSNILIVKTPMEEPEVELEEVMQDEPSRELKMPQVKFVELSLVGLALALWIVAIALFFHRWGKIRMLLPYQPDFKEKPAGSSCTSFINPHLQFAHSRIPHEYHGQIAGGICSMGAMGMGLVSSVAVPPTPVAVPAPVPVTDSGCSPMRPRLNSFIPKTTTTMESSNKVPMELRIYRKTKSAECLSPTTSNFHPDDDIQFIDF